MVLCSGCKLNILVTHIRIKCTNLNFQHHYHQECAKFNESTTPRTKWMCSDCLSVSRKSESTNTNTPTNENINKAFWMRQIYKNFKSPYVGIWLFWQPALVVNSPEIARRVLVKDSDVFRNRFLSSGKSDPVGALNIFTVNDPIWSKVRRRLTSVFTAAKLRNLNGITRNKANDLVWCIKEETAKGEHIDLRKMCTFFTTDVIGESAFGVATDTLTTGDSIMRKVTRDISAFNLYRGLCWSSIFFFPALVDIFRFSLFPKDTVELLRKIFRSVIEQRGGFDQEVKETRDLLDALLKIKSEAAADNETFDENLLLAQAVAFLVGGFDTSGAALSWAVYLLAWNPQCQQRLYEEILEAKERIGDQDFNSDVLSEVTYLNCVIKETLRIFPPMGWLDRVALKDYMIDDKLTIPAGTPVYVNSVAMQMDPQYFPDPEDFVPERFLPENEKNIIPFTYSPFGEGPRICIGMRFAYNTMRQGIAKILLNFEMRVLPNTPKPLDVHIEKNGLFLMPDEKMSVEFVRRNNPWISE